MKRSMKTEAAAAPGGADSHAIADAGLLLISGQVDGDPVTSELAPTLTKVEVAIRHREAVPVSVGSSLNSVVKATSFFADVGESNGFNRPSEKSLPLPSPARSTRGVSSAAGLLFEIDAVAVLTAAPRR